MKTISTNIYNLRLITLIIMSLIFTTSLYSQKNIEVMGTPALQRVNPSQLKPININQIDNSLLWMSGIGNNENSFTKVRKSFNEYWKDKTPGKGSGWKPFKRWEYFWGSRISDGKIPNGIDIYKNWMKFQTENKNEKNNANFEWKGLGPKNQPYTTNFQNPTGVGRVNCITFDPNNPNIVWAGAAFGGIWRSTTGGSTWETFPFTQFLSIGISDIAVAKATSGSSNTIYGATGDADGSFGGINSYSIGVIKTTDNGENWSVTNLSSQISDRFIINRLLVDPRDRNHVFAATSRGLFSTKDGGENWDTLTNAFTRDIEFRPDDPDRLWAAFIYGSGNETRYGLFKVQIYPDTISSDSVDFFGTPIDFAYGEVTRMSIAVNEGYPNFVYLLSCKADGGLHSVIYSPDGDEQWKYLAQTISSEVGNYTWDLLNARSDMPDSINSSSQGFYDLCIAVNPDDTLDVYIGGVNIWRFKENFQPWELHAFWTKRYENQGVPWVHADHHDLKFTSNGYLYSTNDGGVSKYIKESDNWKDLSKGLEITQFYKIDGFRNDEELIVGGTQDNGTSLFREMQWKSIRGGDGMYCKFDRYDGNVIYSSIYYGDFDISYNRGGSFTDLIDTTVTGEKAGWVAPFVVDPYQSEVIYAGYENVWRAAKRGTEPWKKISKFNDGIPIRYIAVAKADNSVIYVINHEGIYRTKDGGYDWEPIVKTEGGGDLQLSSIAIDPKDALHLWFTRSGFNEVEKVFEFTEGKGLTNLTGNLPNIPINCVVYQNGNENNKLFIGTDIGVFHKDDLMENWETYGEKLPNVVVQDLVIHYKSGKLRAGTFGRGLWEVKIANCTLEAPEIMKIGNVKLCEGDTLILETRDEYAEYLWSNGDTTKAIRVSETGSYSIIVTDEDGCTAASEEINVTVIHLTNLLLKSETESFELCDGDSLKLSASPSIMFPTIEWSDGRTGKSIFAKESGMYHAKGISKDGCVKLSDTVEIIVYDLPLQPIVSAEDNILTSSEAFKYQWLFNDEEITFATKQTHTAKKSGYYKVMITNENNCSNMSEQILIEIVGVNDDLLLERNINIHPNPVKDEISITFNTFGTERIYMSVVNIIGDKVLEIEPFNYNGKFSKDIYLRKLVKGVYFLKLEINNSTYVKKIVKE